MGLRFTSTRGDQPTAGWSRAIDGGTAPDGGLWVPEEIPRTFERDDGRRPPERFSSWAPTKAQEWLDDTVGLPTIADALDLPVRLRPLGPRISLLDLSRGPTGAFKDVGARFLAALWACDPRGDGRTRTVLTATSGDTGGAVAAAVDSVLGLHAVVVFPLDRVSDVQRRQFTTRHASVRAVAVRGTFDDCQALVRAAFADAGLVESHRLVSANSINPGRLLPQTLYYGWLGTVAPGRPVVVPSGNLGNVTAAVLAQRMGAALGPVHAAVNENDTLVRVARGDAPRTGPSVQTDSSAMDVAAPSNLERIRWLASTSNASVGDLVDPASVSLEQARAAQRWAYSKHAVLLDPHTSVGLARALELADADPRSRPIVVETAHPSKFPDVVRAVVGVDPPMAPGLDPEGNEQWVVVDADLESLARELAEVIPA